MMCRVALVASVCYWLPFSVLAEEDTTTPNIPPVLRCLPETCDMAAVLRPVRMLTAANFTGDVKWSFVQERVSEGMWGDEFVPAHEIEWVGIASPALAPGLLDWQGLFFVQTTKPVALEAYLTFFGGPPGRAEPVEVAGEICLKNAGSGMIVWMPSDRAAFLSNGEEQIAAVIRQSKRDELSPLGTQLSAAAQNHEAAAVAGSKSLAGFAKIFELGNGAETDFRDLQMLKYLKSASLSLTLAGDAEFSAVLSTTKGAAPSVMANVKGLVRRLRSETKLDGDPDADTPLPASTPQIAARIADRYLAALEVKAGEDRVTVSSRPAGIPKLRDAFLKAYVAEREGAEQVSREFRRKNHMKMALVTIHNRHEALKTPPLLANVTDAQGRPLLSWRVTLLQYMEEPERKLYEKFRLDEPWDSEHNKALLKEIPLVYQVLVRGEELPPGQTSLFAVTGPGTAFGLGEKFEFKHITDGTAHTLLLVDLATRKSVPWTKPEDVLFDPEQPLAMFKAEGNPAPPLFGMLDGSVRTIESPTAEWIRAAVTPDAGDKLEAE